MKTSDYECTHQMEMFDIDFVYFGQVLLVSGLKTLFAGVQSSCKITTPFGPFSDYFLKKRDRDEIVNM